MPGVSCNGIAMITLPSDVVPISMSEIQCRSFTYRDEMLKNGLGGRLACPQ